jgi:uncharacterized membrane protein (UPF0127 family)
MASRPTNAGFRMSRVTGFALGVVLLAILGVVAWRFFFTPKADYCKDVNANPSLQTTAAFCHMAVKEIQLVNDAGQTITITARLADEIAEQQSGYQNVGEAIIAQSSVLFIFGQEITGSFHMCNVTAPLDIAWFRSDGTILDLKLMEPGPAQSAESCQKLYGPESNGAYLYALEAAKDFFKKNNITKDQSRLVVESVK